MMPSGLLLTELQICPTFGGRVMHAIRTDSPGFCGFGEAYFSNISAGITRGWKRHNDMTLNLIVPVGNIRFVLYCDNDTFSAGGGFYDVTIGQSNYVRLTVPPGIWVAFRGEGPNESMLMNLADILYSEEESDRIDLNAIQFDWGHK